MNSQTWISASRQNPCPICQKPDWCSTSDDGAYAVCRREPQGSIKNKMDKSGVEYWLHRIGEVTTNCSQPKPTGDQNLSSHVSRASDQVLDKVYKELLGQLELTREHRQKLRDRGLVDEEIGWRQYRSLPIRGRAKIAKYLVQKFDETTCRYIPGLYLNHDSTEPYWSITGAPGLLVPVRNSQGQIVALKARLDHPQNSNKYIYMSSAKLDGAGPGAPVHVPLFKKTQESVVRLTEGEIKSDVATALSGILTISIAGVGAWRSAIPVLQKIEAKTVRLAFDADARTNVVVASALEAATNALKKEGFQLEVEVWEAR